MTTRAAQPSPRCMVRRASQEVFVDLSVYGLASMCPAGACVQTWDSCTNVVMSVDKLSMRSPSRRQSQARSWMMRIMRSDSTSDHWATMRGNSVHRKPSQLGRKERISQKRRRPAITDPSRAAPPCKSLLAGDPIIGNIRFTSRERQEQAALEKSKGGEPGGL